EFEVIASGLVVGKNLHLCGLVFVLYAKHASAGFVCTDTVGAVIVRSRLIIVGAARDCDFNSFYWLPILREASKDVPVNSRDWPETRKTPHNECSHDFPPILDPTFADAIAIKGPGRSIG